MYFWNCCFEEIVAAKKPVGFKLLNYKFALRLASLKRQLTRGHENWFQHNNNNLLLQLFTAANLQIAPDSTYSHTLSCYSKARRVIVLEKLTKWLHENTAGLREHDEERALLAAIEFIQSSHPDWPRLGDVVAVHCFTTQIVTKERFSTEWTRTRSSSGYTAEFWRNMQQKDLHVKLRKVPWPEAAVGPPRWRSPRTS